MRETDSERKILVESQKIGIRAVLAVEVSPIATPAV
jgi:hypothetical protein